VLWQDHVTACLREDTVQTVDVAKVAALLCADLEPRAERTRAGRSPPVTLKHAVW
jgi:hypothetical protein